MVGEVLISFFFNVFSSAIGLLEFINIPTQAIGTLTNFFAYGAWIVGVDLLGIFMGTVLFWWAAHMSIGLLVWVWKMLPLT